jgi:hypothetical protein
MALDGTAARDVAAGEPWTFRENRSMAEVIAKGKLNDPMTRYGCVANGVFEFRRSRLP